jgi:hypothetical protein
MVTSRYSTPAEMSVSAIFEAAGMIVQTNDGDEADPLEA